MSSLIHHSAIVDKGAELGLNTKVWHFSHISSGAKIGNDCSLGQNVFIASDVLIGDRVKIQNNVSIYDSVRIEDDVFCGPSVVFTNVFNPRAFINRKNEYKKTLIKKGATLGANCTIICGITIGEYSFVAAGALVNKNVSNFALVAGIPAKQIGWMSRFGERLDLPLIGNAEAICPKSLERYVLNSGVCSLLP